MVKPTPRKLLDGSAQVLAVASFIKKTFKLQLMKLLPRGAHLIGAISCDL
jgi:hypothetical protein